MLDFSIRLISVAGAVWVSIAMFVTNGAEIFSRLWWQASRHLGFEEWLPYLGLSREKMLEASQSPAAGAALASLSIFCFLAVLWKLRKPRAERRRGWRQIASA